ncbi:MAG: tetratricopeptide repeat protein, partial [Pseudomonadota bacterium]
QSIVAQGDMVIALTARNNVARILIGRGDLDSARELLDDVLARNAGDVEALTLSGYLHLRRGNARRAAADLRGARDGGGEGFVTSLLAQALWSSGDRAAAVAELKEHPNAPQADVLLTRYLLDDGQIEAARSRVARLLRDDPLSLAANEMNVELGILDGDLERAMLSARIITDTFTDGPLGYHLAARVEYARGNTRSAHQHAVRALELAPEAVEPLELLVGTLLSEGRNDDARRALEDVLAKRPLHAIALWWRGRVSLAEGALEDAAQFFERATQATPEWSRPWQWWARVATARQQHTQAQAILDRGIEATDHAPELVAHRAELDQASGDINAAIERYRFLLHRDPQAPRVVNNLAMLLLQAERGLPDLMEARTLVSGLDAGDDPRLHDTIGQVMARTCAWPRAEAAWRSALDVDPRNATYQLRLADTLLAQARGAEARALMTDIAHNQLSADERDELAQLTARVEQATHMPCVQLSHDNSHDESTGNST